MMKMKKRTILFSLVLLLGGIILLTGCGASTNETGGSETNVKKTNSDEAEPEEKSVKLTYATYVSSNHYQAELDKKMFENIHEQSKGTLTIEPFFDGSLVDPKEWRQELIQGAADIAQAPVGSGIDRYPLMYATGIFNYGITDNLALLQFTEKLERSVPQIGEQFKEVVPLTRLAVGQTWVHTVDKPIRSAEDFKGLNLKAADQASVLLVKALGANPVKLPISESYIALEKGTIDGIVTGADPLITFKLAEVTKYSTPLPYATPWIYSKYMNKEVYNSLSNEQKHAIQENALWWEEQLVAVLEEQVQSALDFAREEGSEIIEMSPEATKEILDVMEENAKAFAQDLDDQGLNGTEMFNAAREIARQLSDQ